MEEEEEEEESAEEGLRINKLRPMGSVNAAGVTMEQVSHITGNLLLVWCTPFWLQNLMCLCALRLLDRVISVIRCCSFLRLFRV